MIYWPGRRPVRDSEGEWPGSCALTATGLLSSSGMFQVLNRGAVWRQIAAAKPCRAVDMGFREIQVEARAGDVMAGGGGAAGPAPDIRHQPPGDASLQQSTVMI